MKLMVVGGGGREHALAWKLAQSPRVQKVYVAPGNGGTADEPGLENVPLTDIRALAAFAERQNVYITVVGPEAPLAAGIVDEFRSRNLKIFGPTRAAAQLEASKDFAKQFMLRHSIPTARHATFTEPEQAKRYIDENGAPIVVKADGLASGKGVVVANSVDEAKVAVDTMFRLFGPDRKGGTKARVLIEEFIEGEEASFMVMCDGAHVLALATSQDHKRLLDGDSGPNTGGMGAYSPAPVVTPQVHARVMREIVLPTVAGMQKEGVPYTGFLYAGLMIDKSGDVKTLEFNCRMGDPETQPIILRLRSDLLDLVESAVEGRLDHAEAVWDRRCAMGVVLAALGYPGDPRKGDAITGLPKPTEECRVFHAGTRVENGAVLTDGGRVLCVTALGDSVKMAHKGAYATVESVHFSGMQFRRDIGHRAMRGASAARGGRKS